ncbi:MAG: uracil-DNA glycosylase family protein [Myxococcales bacterium]|nr:uracil-DNA glycosylase family protein [Myxococcales bacterium]
MRGDPSAARILFVAEAPNCDDTFDADKGYLTVDPDTDPSGRLFHDLFTRELGEAPDRLALTNAVLCLPRRVSGRHPVPASMIRECSGPLRAQIECLDPLIVAPLGTVALVALARIEEHSFRRLRDAVARPTLWFGRMLFPLAHPSRLGRVTRNEQLQRQDWRELRLLEERLGAERCDRAV